MNAEHTRLLCVQAVEVPLKLAQTAAVLEVVHSALGLVRSPVFITGLLAGQGLSGIVVHGA